MGSCWRFCCPADLVEQQAAEAQLRVELNVALGHSSRRPRQCLHKPRPADSMHEHSSAADGELTVATAQSCKSMRQQNSSCAARADMPAAAHRQVRHAASSTQRCRMPAQRPGARTEASRTSSTGAPSHLASCAVDPASVAPSRPSNRPITPSTTATSASAVCRRYAATTCAQSRRARDA